MHTPKEAKKLWCPHAVVACADVGLVMVKGVTNRLLMVAPDEMFEARPPCIANQCAMWRWAQKPNPDWKPEHPMMSSFGRDTRNDAPMYIADTTHGYCGLAGRPS